MKRKTLGQVFAEIRADKSLTMLETALKCGSSEAVVWKLERDRPVRWESVHIIVTIAFKISPRSEKYQTLHLLWLKARQERAEAQPEKLNKRLLSKHGVEATRKFRILIHELDPVQVRQVLAAAQRAAQRL